MSKRQSYSSFVTNNNLPLTEPIPGKDMVKNSCGAFVFKTSNWKQLDRFLILGACGATYYASQRKLVTDNIESIRECIKENCKRVIDRVVEISTSGRAPSNDPALFVLALCSSANITEVQKVFNQVVRTGTHLMHICDYVNDTRGWGRGIRLAFSNWFNNRDASSLAYQAIKYRQRDGWSMRDVLRLVHPEPATDQHGVIFNWIVKNGWDKVGNDPHPDDALKIIWAMETAKRSEDEKVIVNLVKKYKLPWEAIDTKWLNSCNVWEALLKHSGKEALVRNLNRLTAIGLLKPLSKEVDQVIEKLEEDAINVHPIKLLIALKVYQQGHGNKGSLVWRPIDQISRAIESAFYKSFNSVKPTNKRTLICLDVSGSMSIGEVAGTALTPREASSAMAMVTARTEQKHHFLAFSSGVIPLDITSKDSLSDVIRKTSSLPFCSTHLSLPFEWALKNKIGVDSFIMYTDSETNGGVHPRKAMDEYKQKMHIDSKLVVVGMTANNFTVADPNANDNMDVVGFDTAAPQLISDFVSDNL